MNSAKLIDRLDNKDLITSIMGDYYIDDETNIVPMGKDVIRRIDTSFKAFSDVLLIERFVAYDDVEKFMKFAMIDGHDDWYVPSIADLNCIFTNMKSLAPLYVETVWSREGFSDSQYTVTFHERLHNTITIDINHDRRYGKNAALVIVRK